MMRSMTGFARETMGFQWGNLTLEISSVNHRYQELSLRLPREMASFESLMGGMLRSRLGRGKIRLHAEIAWAPQYRAVALDGSVLKDYYRQVREIAGELECGEAPQLSSLLSLPGVFDSPAVLSLVEREVGEALEDLLDKAAGGLREMREREGAHLQEALEEYLRQFENQVGAIETYWEGMKEQSLADLRERLNTLLSGISQEADQGRIAQEVVLMGDKWDISEEFVRSRSHIRQFRSVMAGKNSEGRKLDFLVQEMNREVNTMGSKITDANLRWMVVEAKTLLEKIREQVQNVE